MAKKPGMKNNTFLWGLAAVLGLGVAAVVLTLFLNLIQTETYYVLKEDVPSRAVVTPDMLEPVTVSKGGAPEAALGLEEVQSGSVFAAHPLLAGDILTLSNVGSREDISVGIPDEWVITNFSVGADDAVGGRIQRGYYFDMLVTTEAGSFYPFVNVLALDTTVDLASASSSDAVNTEEAQAGQTTQYVVGMSPENAAKLHQIMRNYGDSIKLVLSPRQNEYAEPNLDAYSNGGDLFSFNPSDGPVNLGEGTDYTFTVLPRDDFGRITESLVTCNAEGNAVVLPEVDENGDPFCENGTLTPRYTPETRGEASSQNDSAERGTQDGATKESNGTETPAP